MDELNRAGDIEPYSPPAVELPKEIRAAGRKKKTDSELLAEYPRIVDCLNLGMGIRPTSRESGNSVNTVQKVKDVLDREKGLSAPLD